MNRIRSAFSSVIVLGCVLMNGPASGQATRPSSRDLLERLLDQSGPGRSWELVNFGIPPEDAPIEQVLAYWTSDDIRNQPELTPNDKTRRRLLAACADHADKLPDLLHLLPDEPAAADVVNVVYEAHEKSKIWEDYDRQSIREWVRQRSRHFRDELIAAARSVKFDDDFRLEHEEDLWALAKLDWPTAEPILRQLADGKDIRVAAVALQVLAEHALASDDKQAWPELLLRLRKIADDRKAPAFARDRAFIILESATWDGRDAWYLSLFAEEGLRRPSEEHIGFTSPLERPLGLDPDHFVPLVVKLLQNTDATTRNAAAWQLVEIPRPDALRPLLPALSDSKNWPEGIRKSLLRAMGEANMPETGAEILKAWPQLDANERVDAALALAHFGSKEAPAKLKAAMTSNTEWAMQLRLVREMVACEALSDDEVVAAIEACCAQRVEAARREAAHNSSPPPASEIADLGEVLLQQIDQQKFAGKLLKRADALEASRPQLAIEIRQKLSDWPVQAVDDDLMSRIRRNNLDETIITAAAWRLPGIRKDSTTALRDLAQHGGPKAGFAAALLGDDTIVQSIFHGTDRPAQDMLVAVARLARTKLPLAELTRRLDDKDSLVARTAEQYLISQDSPESRQIVQARHPGVVLIFGGEWVFPHAPGPHDRYPMSNQQKLTEQLRVEMEHKDGPDAIYAMLSEGGFGNDGQRVIRVHGQRAVLTFENYNGRLLTRDLTAAEYKSLLDLLAAENFDELPNLSNLTVRDGVWYDYLHLTRQGGRRIYINNPGIHGTAGSPYDRLTRLWRLFNNTGTFTAHYRTQDKLPGLQVLWYSREQKISRVWKQGNDFRVLVGSEGAGPDLLTWHAWRDGHIAEPVAEPKGVFPKAGVRTDTPVQPAGEKDVAWAARSKNGQTEIGKYNVEHSKFTPVVTLPEIEFRSDQMWVDGAEGMAYFCVSGDLLRVPVK